MTRKNVSKPLSGIRILVGRAKHQAGALSAELRQLGAEVIEIPFIEIRKPRSFKPLDDALKNLKSYNWLILTSVNGVDAMWERMRNLELIADLTSAAEAVTDTTTSSARQKSRPSPPVLRLRIAAIGPATQKALEQRGMKVDVVPREYVAESVVRSLRRRVNGKRVLLVRAKVARDVIPRELRNAGAHVDVVEAYETVVPLSSRRRLQAVLKDSKRCPHVVTFTSSSTVRNFMALLSSHPASQLLPAVRGRGRPRHMGICMASIGPVTSATLQEMGLGVDVSAREFTIPGLVEAIVRWASDQTLPP